MLIHVHAYLVYADLVPTVSEYQWDIKSRMSPQLNGQCYHNQIEANTVDMKWQAQICNRWDILQNVDTGS